MNTREMNTREVTTQQELKIEAAYMDANREVGACKRRLARQIEVCEVAPTGNNFGLLRMAQEQLYEALAEQSEQMIKYFHAKREAA